MRVANCLKIIGKASHLICLLFTLLLFCCPKGEAGPLILRDVGEEGPVEPEWLILPYGFYTESLELAYGAGGGWDGYFQDQLTIGGAAYGSTNSSFAAYLLVDELQLSNRLFMNFLGSVGNFDKQRTYVDITPTASGVRAGSNDSDPDDFVEGSGWDNWLELTFNYILPIGDRRENSIKTVYLNRGIPAFYEQKAKNWNPFENGSTSFETQLFYRLRTFNSDENEIGRGKTMGLQFALDYDNRDFPLNAMFGGRQRIEVSRDFGWLSGKSSWTALSVDLQQLFSMKPNKNFRQRTIALNAWTSYSPTWSLENDGSVSHRPPNYLGSSLGGDRRMRAYPRYRYNDKAAIYYCAEYRMIPSWNPFRDMGLLSYFNIDWWQIVPFIEVGRVAPEWSFGTLHKDMALDAGLGLRMMALKSVVRLDTAFSDESWSLWAMVGHPF